MNPLQIWPGYCVAPAIALALLLLLSLIHISPTYTPINDASSSNDQFFRFITQLAPRDTLAFDYSNQFSQFQIPINTDPNNPLDPVVNAPGTLDTQLEYDRFSNLNWTQVSKDGNGVFQVLSLIHI